MMIIKVSSNVAWMHMFISVTMFNKCSHLERSIFHMYYSEKANFPNDISILQL